MSYNGQRGAVCVQRTGNSRVHHLVGVEIEFRQNRDGEIKIFTGQRKVNAIVKGSIHKLYGIHAPKDPFCRYSCITRCVRS